MTVIHNDEIDKHIRIKFSFPLIALTVGCCLVVFVIYILLFNSELNSTMYNKIDVATKLTGNQIANLKTNARIAAWGMVNYPGLVEAIIENDRNKIISMASLFVTIAQVDYCSILDADGIVFARTHEPFVYGDSLADLLHVRQAFNGKVEAYIMHTRTIPLGVHAGAPIYDNDMNIIGVVSVGFRLDNQKLVNDLKAITMCETSIYRNDELIASTIRDAGDSYRLGMKAQEHISKTVQSGDSYTGRMDIAGQDALVKYIPIYGIGNEVAGMIGIGYYTSEDTSKIFSFIMIGILITLVVLSLCIFLARFIMKTVERRLGGMMDEVRKADETARTAIQEKNMLENVKNIMNGLDVMIFVNEPKTCEILFMNESMKQHYGIEGDPVGKICYKILQKGLNERCDFCPCLILDREPDKAIVWNERGSLTNCIYRRIDRYIKWPDGQTVHMQHSVDITELIAAKESAELSNRSKGIFLAQMSHEIRTPMNAILGISEIQLQNKNLTRDAEEGYRNIYESGNLLLNIINDILDFSKIDAGKLEITPERYDVPSLINDTALLSRLRYESKPIDFIVTLDKNTPHELIGDELRIKQILHNLLSNSFKYTETGMVELSISAENAPSDEIVTLIFRVKDTGQGMTENQLSRIFDEYSRFNMETNRSVSGTGLGMTITKRLIDMMGGEIHVDSKPDEGSVFTVRLPQIRCGTDICGPEISEKLKNFNFQSKMFHKKSRIKYEPMPYGRVLVVDDVESNLIVAKGLLAPYGLQIETVNSGFAVIEKIKNENVYDIIFMDHMMPKMDGLKTTEILRGLGYTHPIVALTANAVIGQAEMLLANGFDGYISKPIDSRELNQILIKLIKNKKKPQSEKNRETEAAPVPDSAQKTIVSDDLAAAIVNDVNNAIAVLGDLFPGIDSGEDMELFTTTVHGMKSALANIGEDSLSNTALRLEQAGNTGEINVIKSEIPEFISALRSLAERIKPAKTNDGAELSSLNLSGVSGDDLIYLRDNLNIIMTACEKVNIKDAKKALTDLKQRTWPFEINEILNEISVNILRGELIKVGSAVDKANKTLISVTGGID